MEQCNKPFALSFVMCNMTRYFFYHLTLQILYNLFVAIGNANKMACMQNIRNCLLLKPFTALVVLVLMWREYYREFSVHVAPPRAIIYQIVKQSEETGSVFDKRARGCKHSTSIHTEEIVSAAQKAEGRSPRKSV
jgi:hypothetical protein